MTKLAIDIVLLPPEHIMDLCIEINKGDPFGRILAKDDWVPHATLFMGLIDEKDIQKVSDIIYNISNNHQSFNLEIIETYFEEKEDGSRNHGFRIKPTEELQQLHEELMEQLKEYLTTEATPEDFFGEGATTDYINEFEQKWSHQNFDPHITLRAHEVTYNQFPISFTSNKIAMFQLGKGCTCRKLLFSKEL